MKKKVKKIPKYYTGGVISPEEMDRLMKGKFHTPTYDLGGERPMASMEAHKKALKPVRNGKGLNIDMDKLSAGLQGGMQLYDIATSG